MLNTDTCNNPKHTKKLTASTPMANGIYGKTNHLNKASRDD